MRTALATLLATALLAATPAATTSTVTLHQAKVRTFAAALHLTEQPPDATDTTRATIQVSTCRHYAAGYLCHAALLGVSFSGIDTDSTCPLLVNVQPRATHVRDSQCR